LLTALNKVDLPTLGKPTIPACRPMIPPIRRAESFSF
jgi:hypothetical protein